MHAVVARSTFRSQKCKKTEGFRALLEVEMSKKCMPLWREAHFEVTSVKNWQVQSTFGSWDVEKVHAVVARSSFRSQTRKKLWGTEHFWTFRSLVKSPFPALHFLCSLPCVFFLTAQRRSVTLPYRCRLVCWSRCDLPGKKALGQIDSQDGQIDGWMDGWIDR